MTTPELHFAGPADLLAALPYLLGFVPSDDLVAVMAGPAPGPVLEVRAAIGCPITITDAQARRLATTCELSVQQFPVAVLIAVCDPSRNAHAHSVLDAARASLTERGIVVARTLTTHTVTEAGRWIDVDSGAHGDTTPYTDSPATALGVFQGRVIAASRADLQREFGTADAAPAIDLGAHDVADLTERTVTDLHTVITRNGDADADVAARTAALVTAHVALRDQLLRVACGHEHTAARVFTGIAAQVRGRARAELLTMAAVAFYAGEDTTRADLALRFAGEAVADTDGPLPRLAAMVASALRHGLPTQRVRDVLGAPTTTPDH